MRAQGRVVKRKSWRVLVWGIPINIWAVLLVSECNDKETENYYLILNNNIFNSRDLQQFPLFLSHVPVKIFIWFCPKCSDTHKAACIRACMLACIILCKSQNNLFLSLGEGAGLFLPDALCLKKMVLIDSWAPGPYSARVQCGCLVNEVDYRDYNQTGNISGFMCQSRQENLPVSRSQNGLLSFQLVHIHHPATQTHVTVSPG